MSDPNGAADGGRFSSLSTLPDANAANEAPEPKKPFRAKHFDPTNNVFDFGDIAPAETTIKWKGEEWLLKEASTDAATKYKNLAMKSAKMNDAKVIGVDGLADAEPLLVSLCLFRVNKRVIENGKPKLEVVTLAAFRANFPWSLGKQLFEWVKYHSDLDEESEELEDLLKRREELDKKIAKVQLRRKVNPTGEGEDHPAGEPRGGGTAISA